MKKSVSGPPYDSDENEEYPPSQQRENERFRYNNNRNPSDPNRDNFRFPLNNDNFNSRNPQVRKVIKRLGGELCKLLALISAISNAKSSKRLEQSLR